MKINICGKQTDYGSDTTGFLEATVYLIELIKRQVENQE
jgi:hypothetical protein